MVYVRVLDGTPLIRVYSFVLLEVPESYVVLQEINELNQQYTPTKWLHVENSIVCAYEIIGVPFAADQLVGVIAQVGGIVDSVDQGLQNKFGGRLPFGEFKAPQ